MGTSRKRPARGTSNTLKKLLNDPDYLKAYNILERAEKNALKNGLYSIDDE